MRSPKRQVAQAWAVAGLLTLATACGSAIPHDEVIAASRGVGGPGTASGTGTGSQGAASTGGTTGAASAVGGTTGAAGSATTGGTTGGATTGSATTGGSTGAGATGGAAPPATAGGTSGGGGDTSPIIVGTVGNFSGAPGVVNKPGSIGVQVWAKAVNAKGGIGGHPVQVIVVDDQSDPARYRQILQDLVENKHVIAFVGNGTSQTVQAGTQYLEKVRVPVIGSGDGSPAWRSSKMQFSVAGSADALVYGDFAIAKKLGMTKIAVLSCVEASSCTSWKATSKKYAPKVGVTLAYEADISIAQNDFTSECLGARNAGAQVMAVIADGNTAYRAARSCSAQNYHPKYIMAAAQDADLEKPDLEGAIGAMHTFPFFGVPGNPVADEFSNALKRYGADEGKAMYLATGYASGKLFEAAFLKGVGKGKPTSAGVLAGLWGLPHGETLGGVLLPIAFHKEAGNEQSFCYYDAEIKNKKWTAPDGMKPTCPARP
jgi:branched-chain amino acid transport system substrate-binding protein